MGIYAERIRHLAERTDRSLRALQAIEGAIEVLGDERWAELVEVLKAPLPAPVASKAAERAEDARVETPPAPPAVAELEDPPIPSGSDTSSAAALPAAPKAKKEKLAPATATSELSEVPAAIMKLLRKRSTAVLQVDIEASLPDELRPGSAGVAYHLRRLVDRGLLTRERGRVPGGTGHPWLYRAVVIEQPEAGPLPPPPTSRLRRRPGATCPRRSVRPTSSVIASARGAWRRVAR